MRRYRERREGEPMRVLRSWVGVVWGIVSCGGSQKVNSFDVQPQTACPGDQVTLSWDVSGKATLSTLPRSSGAYEPEPTADDITAAAKPVASKQQQPVTVTETTWYVVRAVDAQQAKDPWSGAKHVDVPVKDEPRGVDTDCTENTCSATFTVDGKSAGAQVIRIYGATITSGGKHVDGKVCVTHGAVQGQCISGDDKIEQTVPLAGPWTLQTTLAAPPAAPPRLTVTLHIGCP